MNDIEKQVAVLMNGSEYGDEDIKSNMTAELKQRLMEAESDGRPLEVYCGYDVTAPDIHLGHTITMRKLRQFQEFGHNVTFLIGTFTTFIGDPSDRDKARAAALPDNVRKNAETYAEQAFRILDREKTFVRYNHEWLSGLTFTDVIAMSSHFTVQQFLSRERLRRRIENNEPLWLRELFYPLAQGYDAVALKSDVQIGATEQLFNLMAGRKLQEVFGLKPQICITFPVLTGTDGELRMSKSIGNYIGVNEPPEVQYEKVMSIPDKIVFHYFNLLTRWSPEQIKGLQDAVKSGSEHPMDAKKKLAWEIVDSLHGTENADNAAGHFIRVHQDDGYPDDIPQYSMTGAMNILDLLVETGLCASRSEARRAVQEKSIRMNGVIAVQVTLSVEPQDTVIQRGKRKFVRLKKTA
ncbi:MAG: tyrosine--tRNA ligase [Dehalococcoidales bacterium]|nr:tyrosine--tRNA ligase [Dehalococcoidales bacterium]